ncbi:MAG: dynamin family protein, partial [Oscillospiraceae bacterium]
MESERIVRDFALLKRIVSPENSANVKVDLSAAEKLISNEMPQALEDNAPSNFPQLYFDFKQEFERFKEFILFDKLIGKNVVALGGGFSTGKSSFVNSILEKKMLPADITPATSVPTYIVSDENISVYG